MPVQNIKSLTYPFSIVGKLQAFSTTIIQNDIETRSGRKFSNLIGSLSRSYDVDEI